ncbi:MAG: trehalase family glycosidase [Candidatus Kerfeldbacteria bacterium]
MRPEVASKVFVVKKFIHDHWNDTVRTSSPNDVVEIRLPYPFSVPTAGPVFHMFFYWDTYFINEGLLRDGQHEQARHNVDDVLFMIDSFGYMPNFVGKGGMTRSQPPVASCMVRALYEFKKDDVWLRAAYATLEKEYLFWMSKRKGPRGLNHYGSSESTAEIAEFGNYVEKRIIRIPKARTERSAFMYHASAEAESGWDFTPRFKRRCLDFYAVDLNSLLFAFENNMAESSRILKNGQSNTWEMAAVQRSQLMNQYCWDDGTGCFYDYDAARQHRSSIMTAATLFPLWLGLASKQQAERIHQNILSLELEHGIVTCVPGAGHDGETYQWDAPNGWPPLQFTAIAGCLRYGFSDTAKRLAEKYLSCVTINFIRTGNLWEKYNVITGGIDTANEYGLPPMLGWTAGTFLYACDVLGL